MRELCGGRKDCFTAGCGGGRSGQKKNGGRKKSDATLFLYEESGYRKSILPPHRIRLHRQERGQMGFICAKKKGQRRIPTALGSGKPATPKNNAYPFGCGCIRCLQKIYTNKHERSTPMDVNLRCLLSCTSKNLPDSEQTNTIVYTQYVKNACNYGVLHSKGSQISAICNYLFVLEPGSGTDS